MKAFFIVTSLIFLGAAGSVLAQPYRDTLQISQVEIFQRMLSQTQEEAFEKVQKSAIFLNPLFSALNEKFGVDMKTAVQNKIAQKDREGLENSLLHLIFLDMTDLLQIAGEQLREKNMDQAKIKIKVAYQDYLLLSPSISVKSFGASQKIKNDFRILTLGTESTLNQEEYKRLTSDIQQGVASAYPDFKIR